MNASCAKVEAIYYSDDWRNESTPSTGIFSTVKDQFWRKPESATSLEDSPINVLIDANTSICKEIWGIGTHLVPRQSWEKNTFYIKGLETLGAKSKEAIGKHGIKRFHRFKKYKNGWDGAESKKVSPMSIASMEAFLEIFGSKFNIEPSLFLSRHGNLMLGWEDGADNSIELEFGAESIQYYIESLELEEKTQINPANISQLVTKLS